MWSDQKKKKSPRQRKRNLERQELFNLKNVQNDNVDTDKHKLLMRDSTTQTEDEKPIELIDTEAQTDDHLRDNFEEHMQQKHTKHTCVRCSAKLESKDMLDAHFRAKHKAF